MPDLSEVIKLPGKARQAAVDKWMESLEITPDEGYFRFERNDALHIDENHLGLLISNKTFAAHHNLSGDGTIGYKHDCYNFWSTLERKLDRIDALNDKKLKGLEI